LFLVVGWEAFVIGEGFNHRGGKGKGAFRGKECFAFVGGEPVCAGEFAIGKEERARVCGMGEETNEERLAKPPGL
jgi:hypothetical protein